MKSAPNPDKREGAALPSAAILPFRLRVARGDDGSGSKRAPEISVNPPETTGKKSKTKKETNVASAERPTFIIPRYRGWLKQAAIASILLHLIAFAFFHFRFLADVERAANSGGLSASDGSVIVDVQIVTDAKLTPSETPTNMTSPDAKSKSNELPREQQKQKQNEVSQPLAAPKQAPTMKLPEESDAPPKKTETDNTAQSPNQEKKNETPKQEVRQVQKQKAVEQKKKQDRIDPSAATAPNRAAGNRNQQNQTGTDGNIQNGGQANVTAYNALVLNHLQRFRTYPDQARSQGVTGVSTVRFTLAASGAVVSVSLAGSSGAGVLDEAALAMVRRASPFPPIPPGLGRASMSFAAPVRFNLR